MSYGFLSQDPMRSTMGDAIFVCLSHQVGKISLEDFRVYQDEVAKLNCYYENDRLKHRDALKMRFAGISQLIDLVDEGRIVEYEQIWHGEKQDKWDGWVIVDGVCLELRAQLVEGGWQVVSSCQLVEAETGLVETLGADRLTAAQTSGTNVVWPPQSDPCTWEALWSLSLGYNNYSTVRALSGLMFWLLLHRNGRYPKCLVVQPQMN